MNRFFVLLVFAMLFHAVGCSQNIQTKVLIETDFGNIKVILYDETPLHRDNFIKLVNEGFYDGTLFHRVIEGFMIQGGDPKSVAAAPGERLGGGGPGYEVDAEIVYPKYFHKKGALAAARQPDQVNPKQKSSGSQFYIVQGELTTEDVLKQMEQRQNQQIRQAAFMKFVEPFKEQITDFQRAGDEEGFHNLLNQLRADAEPEISALTSFEYTEDQIVAYTSLGGTPQLDGEYTVFGEVVEGLGVIDKIAALKTDQFDRPITDVSVKMTIIKE